MSGYCTSPLSPPAPQPQLVGVTQGEPLTSAQLPELHQIVLASLRNDPQATQRIEVLKNQPGWRICMLTLAMQTQQQQQGQQAQQQDEYRTMCLILFKNQLDLLFRRTHGPSAISKDAPEKEQLKRMILEFHHAIIHDTQQQYSQRVAGYVSVCVGVIARQEWPSAWPTLFPSLLEGLQKSESQLTTTRTCYTLHQVMKSLESARFLLSRSKFQQATQMILSLMRVKFIENQEAITTQLTQVIQSNGQQQLMQNAQMMQTITTAAKLSELFLKCFNRLILSGVDDLSKSQDVQSLFPFYLDQLQKYVTLLPQFNIPATSANQHPQQLPFYDTLAKCSLMMFRTIHQALDTRSTQFSAYFLPYVHFSLHLLQHNASQTRMVALERSKDPGSSEIGLLPTSTVLEPLCCEAMQYLTFVVRLYSRPSPNIVQQATVLALAHAHQRDHISMGLAGSQQVSQAMQQIYTMMDGLFTTQMIQQLMQLLLQHYLVLKHVDIELWLNEPEQFYIEERSGCNNGDDGTGDDATIVVTSSRSSSSSADSEFTLRTEAETLLKMILEKYDQVSASYLIQVCMQCVQACPPGTMPPNHLTSPAASPTSAAAPPASAAPNMLLLKESVYSALGYGYLLIPRLLAESHNTTFLSFFTTVLAQELSNPSPAYRIIRRRIIWLVGEWIEQVDDSTRIPIYHAIVTLLKENDLIVRMTAIDTLYKLIDHASYECVTDSGDGDSEENPVDLTANPDAIHSAGFITLLNTFQQHLSEVITLLFQILSVQLAELPNKQHLLIIISKILDVMKSRILQSTNTIDTLLVYLPKLWTDCVGEQNHNMLRTNILDVITKLISALGYKSQIIHSLIIVPMLSYIFDPSRTQNETNLCVEGGFDLWKCTLKNCVTYTPELNELFKLLLAYMSSHTAHLRACVELIESYVHLGRNEFLSLYATHLGELFATLVISSHHVRPEVVNARGSTYGVAGVNDESVVTEDAIVLLMPVLEAITQLYPQQAPTVFQKTFQSMIASILDCARMNSLTEQQKLTANIHVPSDQVLAAYFNVLGRLFFQNFDGSLQLLCRLCQGGAGTLSPTASPTSPTSPLPLFPMQPNELLGVLLDVWTRKIHSIANVYQKKVCVLGMIHTLSTCDSQVLHRLKSIMACVRRVEIELNQPGAYMDQPDWTPVLKVPPEQRVESHRIQLMLKDDPANNIQLRAYFLEKLQEASVKLGPQQLEQHIQSTCEAHVWQQIQSGNFATR